MDRVRPVQAHQCFPSAPLVKSSEPKWEATIGTKRNHPHRHEIHIGPDPGAAPAQQSGAEHTLLRNAASSLALDIYLSSVSSRLICPQRQNSI